MKKEFRIQVRTEVYETYVIKVDEKFGDSPNDDEEALEIALAKLDNAYNNETDNNDIVYIEEVHREFGGFTTIQDGESVILGKFKYRELPDQEDIS